MKTHHCSKAFAGIVGILVMFSVMMAPSARALSLNYSDSTWEYMTATGPSLTKPGNTEIYTVSGKLAANTSGAVHIKLWLYNGSQALKVLVDDDSLIVGNYLVNSSFAKSYQVTIPADAENNNYIFATVDARTRHFTNFTLTLVQNSSYAELQLQLNQSQTQASNLTTQLSNLQKSNSSLQEQQKNLEADNNALKAQLDELKGNITYLQSQLDSLQANNTALQADNDVAHLQLNTTSSMNEQIANVTELETNVGNLTDQVIDLNLEVNSLQAQINTKTLLMYVITGSAIALAATTGFLVFRARKKKKATPTQSPRR
jgi:phage shock protein A